MKPFLKSGLISTVLLTSPLFIQTPIASAFELPGKPTTKMSLFGDIDPTALATTHSCNVYAPNKEVIDIDVTPAMGGATLNFAWEGVAASWSYDGAVIQTGVAMLTPNAAQKYETTDPARGTPQSYLCIHNPSATGVQTLLLDFARLTEVSSPAAVTTAPKLEGDHIVSSRLVTIFGKDGHMWGRAADGREARLGTLTHLDALTEVVKSTSDASLSRQYDPSTGKTKTTVSITE